MSWIHDPLTVFDLESTGLSRRNDRIVTGYVATIAPVGADGRRDVVPGAQVLINPGIDIPAEASDVHGVTTEVAKAKGCDPRDGVEAIAYALELSLKAGIPVLGYNLAYDCTLLHWELIRHDLPTIGERLGLSRDAAYGPIVDAYVLDKHVDPYRSGSRKLGLTAKHYGVVLDSAHTADADALAASKIVYAIIQRHHGIRDADLRTLHGWQKGWRAYQMQDPQHGLQAHKRKTNPEAWCDPCWPLCVDLTHPEQ